MKDRTLIVSFAAVFLFNIGLVYLVDLFTIKFSNGRAISGNGNLGIIPLAISIGLYVVLLCLLIIVLKKSKVMRKGKWMTMSAAAALLIFLSFEDVKYMSRITDHLYLIKGYGIVNQYTNTLFMNYYHFFIGLILVYFVLLLVPRQV